MEASLAVNLQAGSWRHPDRGIYKSFLIMLASFWDPGRRWAKWEKRADILDGASTGEAGCTLIDGGLGTAL